MYRVRLASSESESSFQAWTHSLVDVHSLLNSAGSVAEVTSGQSADRAAVASVPSTVACPPGVVGVDFDDKAESNC